MLKRFFDWPASGRSSDVCTVRCSGRSVTCELTNVARLLGILERHEGLCTRDHHALDRLVEELDEPARGQDAATARKHLPPRVDVLNERATQQRGCRRHP
jgi:hypothetical protein